MDGRTGGLGSRVNLPDDLSRPAKGLWPRHALLLLCTCAYLYDCVRVCVFGMRHENVVIRLDKHSLERHGGRDHPTRATRTVAGGRHRHTVSHDGVPNTVTVRGRLFFRAPVCLRAEKRSSARADGEYETRRMGRLLRIHDRRR